MKYFTQIKKILEKHSFLFFLLFILTLAVVLFIYIHKCSVCNSIIENFNEQNGSSSQIEREKTFLKSIGMKNIKKKKLFNCKSNKPWNNLYNKFVNDKSYLDNINRDKLKQLITKNPKYNDHLKIKKKNKEDVSIYKYSEDKTILQLIDDWTAMRAKECYDKNN